MVLSEEVIKERLKHLREILVNLRELQRVPKAEFLSTYRHYWLAERGLQLAAETLFDIGNHILSGYFQVAPQDYESVLDFLLEKKVISPNLRDKLKGLGGFRNILVHEYTSIDRGKVFRELKAGLDDFDSFIDEILLWMKKNLDR
jgi:uncharacterized protein YutE (UPF0331/DUF86 family)